MKILLKLAIAVCIACQSLYAQDLPDSIDHYFAVHPEIYFTFKCLDRQFEKVNNLISIDKIQGEEIYAYASKKEFQEFYALGIDYKKLQRPSLLYQPIMKEYSDIETIRAWNFYPTYSAYDSILQQFAVNYPTLCQYHSLGTLPSGREILAVKISDSVHLREGEPQFLYTSSMHGDELTAYVLSIRFIEFLLSNYSQNPEIKNIVDSIEIWINPLANPDGAYAYGNHTVQGATRYNANGVDLNRNFPDPEDGPHPDGNVWQAETSIFMGFADTMDFTFSANFHGGSEVVNYPWDTWSQLHADNSWYILISNEYADTAQAFSPSGYFDDFGTGVTNGFAWYTISGGRQDYMNFFHQCREVTLEISNTKLPPASTLPFYWNYNYKSMLNYLRQTTFGIHGFISDSVTAEPLKAKLFIANHDTDSSHIYSSLPHGNYHRFLYAGTYDLTFSAPGYQSKTISAVTLSNYSKVNLNVALYPLPPVASFTADDTITCTGSVQFNYTAASNVAGFLWKFGDGKTSTISAPQHLYATNGTYTVKLIVTNAAGTDSMVKTNYISVQMPSAPIFQDTASCGAASFVLHASGNGKILWYDTIAGGTLLDTGNVFTTPFLNATKTYYVQDEVVNILQNTGKPDNSGGGSYYSGTTPHYLVFDSYKSCVLESVKVYANIAGNRLITLRDASGNLVQSANVYIPSGSSRVNLDFNIAPGNDYQLGGSSNPDLYRNNAGINYPYILPGILSIKHSSASSNPTAYYYYFYDWEVRERNCLSPRMPLHVFINSGPPLADFSFIQDYNTYYFSNLSFDANQYYWDFGDGTNSTEENPEHVYNQDGSYSVSLICINACSSDTAYQSIQVNTATAQYEDCENSVKVFPNPAKEHLVISLNHSEPYSYPYHLEVYNAQGQRLFETTTYAEQMSLDLQLFGKGLHILKITTIRNMITRKVIFY